MTLLTALPLAFGPMMLHAHTLWRNACAPEQYGSTPMAKVTRDCLGVVSAATQEWGATSARQHSAITPTKRRCGSVCAGEARWSGSFLTHHLALIFNRWRMPTIEARVSLHDCPPSSAQLLPGAYPLFRYSNSTW